MAEVTIMTIGEFIDLVLQQTKVVQAGKWFERVKNAYGKGWCSACFNQKTIADVGYGISIIAIVSKNRHSDEEAAGVLLAEVLALAAASGVVMPEHRVNCIPMLKELVRDDR